LAILINLFPYTMLLIVCSILAARASKRSIPQPFSQSFNNTAAIVAEIASFKKPQNKTVSLLNYILTQGQTQSTNPNVRTQFFHWFC
jgi:hypothetical protein